MKDNIKKAFESAEQEIQEKEIAHYKGIIKDLLQRKKDKEKQKEELDNDIKLIKQDLEDLKAGRLDKIKERHDITPEATKISPINVTIINNQTFPTQPWRWVYAVNTTPAIYHTDGIYSLGSVTTTASSTNTLYLSGSTAGTFAGGTYDLGDYGIVNL